MALVMDFEDESKFDFVSSELSLPKATALNIRVVEKKRKEKLILIYCQFFCSNRGQRTLEIKLATDWNSLV